VYAQVIDDSKGTTLLAVTSLKDKKGTPVERAHKVGEEIAKQVLSKKIEKVVFDRGGFLYQGQVKAVAEGARKGGLNF